MQVTVTARSMLTENVALQGVPGHVYAHVLAHRIRSGRVSVDLSDGHLEPVEKETAGASPLQRKIWPWWTTAV